MKALLFDFSRVLLFHKDESYTGSLNEFYRQQKQAAEYDVFQHYKLNTELLEYINSLQDIDCYILTSETIQNDPAFAPFLKPFKKVYSAIDLGLSKKNPAIYEYVAKDIAVSPEEILFIDDSNENIEAAKQAGLQTLHYHSNQEILTAFSNLVIR